MPKLVKDGAIIDDQWALLAKPDTDADTVEVPTGAVIIPLSVWLAQKQHLSERTDVGVWIDSDESANDLAEDAKTLPLIAVNFPAFMDGRSFSNARLLRERFGFTGELRAVGGFIRDQLCYLSRCGVNAFRFDDDSVNLEEAKKSLEDFTEFYQAGSDQPTPLFRRRTA
ncbi:DUF934 domain-containing protein [Gilvimarinus sp. SDUM040013]|uniref:DUF934 domain-containing protein n=1 Tax=Gilvimarinus gilvus TaxID=3058038 RepID=A0ABU4RW31_9GAMM|nr:DUF934 domain-containing protein [Gilvimarinus sp. SDUM040013]MDO3384997.1 DUF934 domain-containing protein [Gilvimarinus sp. SDUM040013]MDX6848372.1 DUF934 domain-containing protein [Gilvimarinus sp. SDUM040013]